MANGSLLTPTPLRSNSMGKTSGSLNAKGGQHNNNNNNSGNNNSGNNSGRSGHHEENDAPSGVNGLSDKGNLLKGCRQLVNFRGQKFFLIDEKMKIKFCKL